MSQTTQEHEFYQQTIASAFEDVAVLTPLDRATMEERRLSYFDCDFIGPFDRLSRRLYETFVDLVKPHIESRPSDIEYHWRAILHGYEVAGRGIARCLDGYNKFYEVVDEPGSLDECKQALVHPQTIRAFTQLAKMTNEENGAYELWLGLKNEATLSRGSFTFNPDLPAFSPDSKLFDTAHVEAEAERRDVANAGAPHRVCPALRYIPMIWTSNVEAAHQEGLLEEYLNLTTQQGVAH